MDAEEARAVLTEQLQPYRGMGYKARNPGARLLDISEEARLRIPLFRRLGYGRLHIAPILDREAQLGEPVVETRISDCRRAHVHAAATRAEIERGADDGETAVGHAAEG